MMTKIWIQKCKKLLLGIKPVKVQKNEQEQLNVFNRVFLPTFTDLTSKTDGEPLKILILGNSITLHGISEEVGWLHCCGMAASSDTTDYVHLLHKKLQDQFPQRSINIRISNFAEFERNPNAIQYNTIQYNTIQYNTIQYNTIDSILYFNPEYIICQLGENVINIHQFSEQYKFLLSNLKKQGAITIITTPFWASIEKNKMINNAVKETNSFLVDLSHIPLMNPENYAKNEKSYKGNKSEWKNEGVGMHPGDLGMENIANNLFVTLNSLIELKTEYDKNKSNGCK